MAISQDSQSPIQAISQRVAPIVIPTYIFFSLSAVISAVAFITRVSIGIIQFRRRRRDIAVIGMVKPNVEQLATKIEDHERSLKMVRLYTAMARKLSMVSGFCFQIVLGLALTLCEDLPMAGIGAYFLSQKYEIPTFQLLRYALVRVRASLRTDVGA
jgi:hypothetical protein